MIKVVQAVKEADYYVVVGTSLLVYPAVDLPSMIRAKCILYSIDPENVDFPVGLHLLDKSLQINALQELCLIYKELCESDI